MSYLVPFRLHWKVNVTPKIPEKHDDEMSEVDRANFVDTYEFVVFYKIAFFGKWNSMSRRIWLVALDWIFLNWTEPVEVVWVIDPMERRIHSI